VHGAHNTVQCCSTKLPTSFLLSYSLQYFDTVSWASGRASGKRWQGGNGISWTIRKSFAPRSRRITMPAPLHFYSNTGRMLFLMSIHPVWKFSDEVLVWLSVWSEVQMICIWSSWCHCHPVISCFIKIQIGLAFLVPANPSCPGKRGHLTGVCLSMPPNSPELNSIDYKI